MEEHPTEMQIIKQYKSTLTLNSVQILSQRTCKLKLTYMQQTNILAIKYSEENKSLCQIHLHVGSSEIESEKRAGTSFQIKRCIKVLIPLLTKCNPGTTYTDDQLG